jgi:hypothetical protein
MNRRYVPTGAHWIHAVCIDIVAVDVMVCMWQDCPSLIPALILDRMHFSYIWSTGALALKISHCHVIAINHISMLYYYA